MLSEKDDSLAQKARNAPAPKIEKRRTSSSSTNNNTPVKKQKRKSSSSSSTGAVKGVKTEERQSLSSPTATTSKGQKSEIAVREIRGMENLANFIADKEGGDRSMVEKYRCRVTVKPSDGRYDVNYFNEHARRFRSMLEVGRFLNLVLDKPASSTSRRSAAAAAGIGNLKKKRKRGAGASSVTKIEAEKKRLRRELDRLRKQYGRASKSLDAFLDDDKDAQYPVEDSFLQEEEAAVVAAGSQNSKANATILPTNCPAARNPDIDSFHGLSRNSWARKLNSRTSPWRR